MAAQNCNQSGTRSKLILTVNIDIQDRLINNQIGVVKCFEIVDNAVSTIFIKIEGPEAGWR